MEATTLAPTARSAPPPATIKLAPLTQHIGAQVVDLDLNDVPDDRWRMHQLKDALAQHRVLLLRGQKLSPQALCAIGSLWGPLMDVRQVGNGAIHVPGSDRIKVISNARDASGLRLGDGNSAAQIWHVDASYWEAPPGVTIFYARKTPVPPPKTAFMDMLKVYETLPPTLKDQIAPLRAIHHQYPRGVERQIDETGPSLPLEQRLAGRSQPLVRRHLATGKPLLFLPFRRDCIVEGMNEADSRALLDTLWDHTERSPFFGAMGLEADDVVIWDNSAVVHRREGWPESAARVMWHVTAAGEVPTPMFQKHVVNINALGYDGRGDPSY
ncbi:MAG TPA: TauD/TfdA family dioxygenase [Ramlibacter sp.]|nr:TauD/TfdA family dioxygenase [Ramlibacter sp.]